jgi:phosphate starvation-inducible PhoH-like protein
MSGLIDAERVLKRVQGIAITRLTSADVVRHPLVARIVDAYDKTPSNRDDAREPIDLVATPARKTTARSRNGA